MCHPSLPWSIHHWSLALIGPLVGALVGHDSHEVHSLTSALVTCIGWSGTYKNYYLVENHRLATNLALLVREVAFLIPDGPDA